MERLSRQDDEYSPPEEHQPPFDTQRSSSTMHLFNSFYHQRFIFADAVAPTTDELLTKLSSKVQHSLTLVDQDETQLTQQQRRNNYNRISELAFEFVINETIGIQFYDKFTLNKLYGDTIKTCAILRKYGTLNVYLLYMKISRSICQRVFSKILKEIIKSMCASMGIVPRFKTMCTHLKNQSISLQLQNYAGNVRDNMLLMKVDSADLQMERMRIGGREFEMTEVKKDLLAEFDKQFQNVCLAPLQYPTLLRELHMYSREQLEKCLEQRDVSDIFDTVRDQCFDNAIKKLADHKFALYMRTSAGQSHFTNKDNELRYQEFTLVLNDAVLRNHVKKDTRDVHYRAFLITLIGKDNFVLTHPHVFHPMQKSATILCQYDVADAAVYDYTFFIPLLLIGRYFARTMLSDRSKQSSDRSVLFLCGASGAGKSIVTQALQQFCGGYKWVDGNYQNEQIIVSSMIVMEEVHLDKLKLPLYKQLTDFTSSVKIDIKNKPPVDVSRFCPVAMNSNEDCFSFFEKRHSLGFSNVSAKKGAPDEHVNAVKRRLFVVPFIKKFSSTHRELIKGISIESKDIYYRKMMDMSILQPLLFNFIMAFALHQSDITVEDMQVSEALIPYVKKITGAFTGTLFGAIYCGNRRFVDALLNQLEETIEQKGATMELVKDAVKRTGDSIAQLLQSRLFELTEGNRAMRAEFYKFYDNGYEYLRRMTILSDQNVRWTLAEDVHYSSLHPNWSRIFEDNEMGSYVPVEDSILDDDISDLMGCNMYPSVPQQQQSSIHYWEQHSLQLNCDSAAHLSQIQEEEEGDSANHADDERTP